MIRSRPAASSVTAVQAHPSRSTHTSEDGASTPHCWSILRTHEASEVTSGPNRRNDRSRGSRSTSDFRRPGFRPRPFSATSSPVRASSRKDAPIDEHDTHHIRPKAVANTCSSPSVGVRRHLPWGSLPFDEISDGDRYAPDYLPGTFRSQGFSPSQRFDPTDASWLCFTPHPSLGFGPPERLPHNQPSRLSARRALLPFPRW